MLTLERVSALEVLDSRARPTLSVTVELRGGIVVRAGVPSGASTGSGEARELRDGDESRFAGQGVRQAVANVNGVIADALAGHSFTDLAAVDETLLALDGTSDKRHLGANAIVGVSMAAARAVAAVSDQPLWKTLSLPGSTPRLPVPHFNIVNGGAHAGNRLEFQEFMLAPLGAPSASEAIRGGAEVYAVLRSLLSSQGLQVGLGDEGGFAPDLVAPEEVLRVLVTAIERAGYPAGREGIALAMDPAATQFYRDGLYHVAGESLTSEELITRYEAMVDRFPVWLIEDGLAESDWEGWERLTRRLGSQVQLVGDDIFCTNPEVIRRAVVRKVGNAALIKVNQIGTVTETLAAMRVCREAGWAQVVSHRSGETQDTFIADLATGTGCGQMKSGAPARGERVAKYNRLIEIEAGTDPQLPYGVA